MNRRIPVLLQAATMTKWAHAKGKAPGWILVGNLMFEFQQFLDFFLRLISTLPAMGPMHQSSGTVLEPKMPLLAKQINTCYTATPINVGIET